MSFVIFTSSRRAALNNITIESCASVGLVGSSFKSRMMPVAKVSTGWLQSGSRVSVSPRKKHRKRTLEGLKLGGSYLAMVGNNQTAVVGMTFQPSNTITSYQKWCDDGYGYVCTLWVVFNFVR